MMGRNMHSGRIDAFVPNPTAHGSFKQFVYENPGQLCRKQNKGYAKQASTEALMAARMGMCQNLASRAAIGLSVALMMESWWFWC